MLILGHTWALADVLDNHALAAFVKDLHKVHRALRPSERRKRHKECVEEEAQAADNDTIPAVRDSHKGEAEVLLKDWRCARCEKYIAKVG